MAFSLASKIAVFCAVGAALTVAVLTSEFTGPEVVHLTNKNYEDLTGDGKLYFIKYYAPWCGHCKRLAPVWKELGAELKSNTNVAIAHVDCTTDRDICTAADIKGYPTLKLVHKGEEYKPYRGQRDKDSLKTFVDQAVGELFSDDS